MAAVAAGVAGVFYASLIVPAKSRGKVLVDRIAQVHEEIDVATASGVDASRSEQAASKTKKEFYRSLGSQNESSAIVTFPSELAEHFRRFGYPSVTVRLATILDEPELSGCRRIFWSVGVPIPKNDRNAQGLLLAVAEFTKQERFVQLIDFALLPDVEDLSMRTASINLAILVQK